MFENGMRPVHPGEVLREDFLKPLDMSANALAKAAKVKCHGEPRRATAKGRMDIVA
jgi:plasmid maintenance system antidote protein VapI